MNLYIITPAGGPQLEVFKTCESIQAVAKELPKIHITHYVIFNNSCSECDLTEYQEENLDIISLSINPKGCRSTARNLGLEQIKSLPSGLVNFLDAGDLLSSSALKNIQHKNFKNTLFSCTALIKSQKKTYIREPVSAKFINLINPFYIGAVYLDSEIAKKVKFHTGRKEDWKYWIECIQKKIEIKQVKKQAYIYTIYSKANHAKRKIKLYKEQYEFFRRFLKFSKYQTILALITHYTLQVYLWLFRQKKLPKKIY